jgi:L-rhamnose mutarotase
VIRDAGISDYSIFLDEETLTLFATLKLRDNNTAAVWEQSYVRIERLSKPRDCFPRGFTSSCRR